MEADWEVEIGGRAHGLDDEAAECEAPVIAACWPGLIDLRAQPERVAEVPEAAEFPALAQALVSLNAPDSPVWTAKCDLWPVAAGEFDPDELDAPPESICGLACYIDLLPRDVEQWAATERAVAWAKAACIQLIRVPLRRCRADLVIRQAILTPSVPADQLELGITAYLTACGATEAQAAQTLAAALTAFASTIKSRSTVE